MWVDDTNFYLHRFEPVMVSKLRLVVRKATHGFVADERCGPGNRIPAKLFLREVEVFGPTK